MIRPPSYRTKSVAGLPYTSATSISTVLNDVAEAESLDEVRTLRNAALAAGIFGPDKELQTVHLQLVVGQKLENLGFDLNNIDSQTLQLRTPQTSSTSQELRRRAAADQEQEEEDRREAEQATKKSGVLGILPWIAGATIVLLLLNTASKH